MKLFTDIRQGEDVPTEFVIGRSYHCSWAKSRGMVWNLISYNEQTGEAILRTRATKKEIKTQLSSLRDTNKTIQKKRIKAKNS